MSDDARHSASASAASLSTSSTDHSTAVATTASSSTHTPHRRPALPAFLQTSRFVVAPLVGASDPVWRMLLRAHGSQIVYTQMIDAQRFVSDVKYRAEMFITCAADRPLVVQFAANDPESFTRAALLVEPHCDAVDLNLGCPQRMARTRLFGSYLLDEEHHERVLSIVRAAKAALRIPVLCKIRLLPSLERTLHFCRLLRSSGAVDLLAVHGRTRGFVEERRKGPADLSQVKAIVSEMSRPTEGDLPPLLVWTNGNVRESADALANLAFTGASGCMVGEATMHDPTLFERCGPSSSLSASSSSSAASASPVAPSSPDLSLAELHRRLAIIDEYVEMLQRPRHCYFSPFAVQENAGGEEDDQDEQEAASAAAASSSASSASSTPCDPDRASADLLRGALISDSSFCSPLVSWTCFHAHLARILNGDPRSRFLHHTQLTDEFLDCTSIGEVRAVMREVQLRIVNQRPFDEELQTEIESSKANRQAARSQAEKKREQQLTGVVTLNSKQRKRERWKQRKADSKRNKTNDEQADNAVAQPAMDSAAPACPLMSAPPSTGAGAAALSNKDFKKFLTPMHPTMRADAPAPQAAAKAAATPKPAGSSSSSSSSEAKYASSETKTLKFSRSGIVDPDATSAAGEGEGEDDGSSSSSGKAPAKKGERVLSSRERSFILFQQKQALKATAKTKYRDRTKERNNDANPDYMDSASLAAASAMTPLPQGANYGSATPLPNTSVSIEASKYLGGDLAHTHLVKGLDFALLNKVKEELERNEEAKMEALVQQQIREKAAANGEQINAAMEDDLAGLNAAFSSPSAKTKSSAAASTTSSSSPAASVDHKKALTPAQQAALNMTFHSPLASAIYNAVFDAALAVATSRPAAAAGAVSDLFLPGRMAFDFPMMPATASLVQAQQSINALPTTALTSRTDLSAFAQAWNEEHGVASLPDPLHSKLTAIFTRQSREHEERKLKRKLGHSLSGEDGFNVVKTSPEEQKAMAAQMAAEAAAAKSAATAGEHASSVSGGEVASVVSADADADAPMYTVERPPAASEDSDDDDDIFAGAGTDYRATMDDADAAESEAPMYSVARPPPSPDSAPAAAPASAVPALFNKSAEPAVRQLDPRASAMRDESGSEDEDDIFGGTGAGDDILGAGADGGLSSAASIAAAASGKPLSAAMRSRLRAERYAEAEYGDLYAGGAASYGGLDDDDDADGGGDGDGGEAPAAGSKKAKALEARKAEQEKKHAAMIKAGMTPMRGAQLDDASATPMSDKQRAAKFDQEYSQVASILQSRGVKGLEAAAAPQAKKGGQTPKPQTAEEEERAAKRARILKGFQHK